MACSALQLISTQRATCTKTASNLNGLTTASTRHVPRMSTVYAQTATMTSIWWALQQSDITYCCVRDRLHSLFAPGIFTDGSLMLNLSIFALLCTSFARHADAATCLKCAGTLGRLRLRNSLVEAAQKLPLKTRINASKRYNTSTLTPLDGCCHTPQALDAARLLDAPVARQRPAADDENPRESSPWPS